MRGRPVLRTIRLGSADPSLLRGLLLALLFLAGALAGHLYAGTCGEEAQGALDQYLTDYCAVYDTGSAAASLLSCVVMYFGYGLALFLLVFDHVHSLLLCQVLRAIRRAAGHGGAAGAAGVHAAVLSGPGRRGLAAVH